MVRIIRVVQSEKYLTTWHNHSINHSIDRILLILILFFYGINRANLGYWKKSGKLQKVTTKYLFKWLFVRFNSIKIVWKCSYEVKIEVLLWAPISHACAVVRNSVCYDQWTCGSTVKWNCKKTLIFTVHIPHKGW